MAKQTNKKDDIPQKLDKILENQEVITNYLNTLNQYIMYSQFNVTEQFADLFTALQYGSTLMNDLVQSIKLGDTKENDVQDQKNKNTLNDSTTSDIFSKFPHSALTTPPLFSGSSNNKKEALDCSSMSSTSSNSLSEFYKQVTTAPGLKTYNRKFPPVLTSPNLSIVNESSNTSVLEGSSAATSQSSIISPITRRKHKPKILPLTPVPSDGTPRSKRAAAPSSLKEPSLKKKMRRT